MSKASDLADELLRSMPGGSGALDAMQGDRDKAAAKNVLKSLRKMLQQAVNGERRALNRAEEAEADVDRIKRRAQNNIDRAFNRGVAAAGGDATVRRIVRHPEFGTS